MSWRVDPNKNDPELVSSSFDESMLGRILSTGVIGLFRENLITDTFEINQTFRQILKIAAEHTPHSHELSSRLQAHDATAFQDYLEDVRKTGSATIEIPLKRDDGEFAWIRLMSIAEYASDGQLIGYFGSIQDVSGRRNAEEKTRRAEEALNHLMESTNAGFYEIDSQKFQFSGSPIVAHMFGLPESSTFEPGYFRGLVHPDDMAAWDALIPSGEKPLTRPVELRVRGKDNQYFWAEITVARKRGTDGTVSLLHGLVRNIDSRKRNEIELQATNERFSLLTDAVAAAILDIDFRTGARNANERFYEMFGLPKNYKIEITDMTSWVYPDDQKLFLTALHSPESLESGFEIEYRIIRKDQTVFWVRHTRKVMKEKGVVTRSANSFVDITAQKTGELEIRAAREQEIASQAAYKAKDRFFASMAHELRTPLNAISNYSQLLTEDLADLEEMDPATIISDANRIASAAEYLRSLVDNVLDMSKISTGMLDLYYSPASIADVINHVNPIISPLAAKKGISFDVDIEDGDVQVQIDKLRVNQVLINLLSNAVKFTETGHVSLKSQIVGGEIIFKIQDTGIGMSATELAMLFQEFRQASAETAAKHGGSGLGLALSQRLATLMGGNITVESAKGLGSTFLFVMPICPPNQPPV